MKKIVWRKLVDPVEQISAKLLARVGDGVRFWR